MISSHEIEIFFECNVSLEKVKMLEKYAFKGCVRYICASLFFKSKRKQFSD